MAKKEQSRRRNFTPEYKAEVVQLVKDSGKSAHAVARDLRLTPSAVGLWVRQTKVDAGPGGIGPLTSSEREELAALRKENPVRRQEREILKRATASFAKEGTS
jgi:transposase